MYPLDLLDDGVELHLLVVVDEVRKVLPLDRPVGRHDHDIQVVDLLELVGLGVGGACHAGELRVHPEEVLECYRGEGLGLAQDLHSFLGLDRLVETAGVAASGKYASGELVDDLDLAVVDDVVDVPLVQPVGDHRLGAVVDHLEVAVVVDAGHVIAFLVCGGDQKTLLSEDPLQVVDSLLGEGDVLALLVDPVVAALVEGLDGPPVEQLHLRQLVVFSGLGVLLALLEELDDSIRSLDLLRVVLGLTRDDERSAGLVYEDRVDLVDYAVGMSPLDLLVETPRHVVAKIVEAQFVVGTVCDVALVGLPLAHHVLVGHDDSRCQPQIFVHRSHPGGVSGCQVLVDRDDVDPLSGKGVQVGGGDAGEGLSLAGLHLEDVSLVEHDRTHYLDIEVALAEDPPAGLACHGEGLGQNPVETGRPFT